MMLMGGCPQSSGGEPAPSARASRWAGAVALLGLYLAMPVPVAAAEVVSESERTYRYDLLESKAPALCEHMQRVYNENFRQPWRWPAEKLGDDREALRRRDPIFTRYISFYPSSPEYDAISWAFAYTWNETIKRPIPFLYAKFDIDNDGDEDWVMKRDFFASADRGEILNIFDVNAFDPMGPLDFLTVVRGKNNAGSNQTPPAHIIRAFVYEGVSYLSLYEYGDYYAKSDDEKPGPGYLPSPHAAPRVLKIVKLIHGSRKLQDYVPPEYEVLCRYDMVELPAAGQ